MMEPRLILGYGILAVLIVVAAVSYRLWRRAVIRDRMMRWGSPHPPRRQRRRGSD